mmetsp:Transcript_14687/g.28238  ORF Transcript_14687/g.28238 Transcript_14687/m.28238 type:complete len:411 (+) Transcript_14687:511-1743(+)|eukprot:CAMPEP_0114236360 /NCGR_PEP_ID=MMETSP0058-20121206/6800_1 /TAXON_ID=36894 /ORGANISM="Pyramimonas parkeae, CCMP726" /LENGTH=410 /DNA_ID=CAMNT_0001348299 /DNA_START=486 /DNA_END=1718 /DNA_ORIENTATION=-
MALRAMPFVIINLGGEMVYILEQRLRAQNIPPDKSVKVLHDVVRTMFSSKFISEVFKPAAIYSTASTRQIFERLAHSSIMRLSESSMDKLYDLMTMGLKYQLLACKAPDDILQVTRNHIMAILACINDPNVMSLVKSCEHLLLQQYQALTWGEWSQLRQTLISFLHDKRIKVSLFLQEGIQISDGRIALPAAIPSPTYTRLYGRHGAIKMISTSGESTVSMLKLAEGTSVPEHPVALGGNLYAKDRPSHARRQAAGAAQATSLPPSLPAASRAPGPNALGALAQLSTNTFQGVDVSSPSTLNADDLWRGGGGDGGAQKELNMLASLIGHAPKPADNFKINLFPDANDSASPAPSEKIARKPQDNTIIIDNGRTGGGLEDLMKSFDLNEGKQQAPVEDADDLLALMDGLDD